MVWRGFLIPKIFKERYTFFIILYKNFYIYILIIENKLSLIIYIKIFSFIYFFYIKYK